MAGLGTLINVITIIVGTALGLIFGSRFPEQMKKTVMNSCGLFSTCMGISMYIGTQNSIFVVLGLVIGVILGEWWHLEELFEGAAEKLQRKAEKLIPSTGGNAEARARFISGMLSASLIFCIGPVAILGAIQDGLSHDIDLLVVKSILDGLISIAFASTMGVGVGFSVIPLAIYQGVITLLARQADAFMSDAMTIEMTAVGGVVLVGLALSNILEIKKIRVSSMLPSLFIAPLLVWLASLF